MLNKIKGRTKERMLKAVQSFFNDIRGVRVGRARPSLLDGLVVNVHGGHQKLNQIASVSVMDSRTLSIRVWDINIMGEVKNAILNANLGFNCVIEGNTARVTLPYLTREVRERLVKLLCKFAENARVAIRNIRRDSVEEIEKMKESKKISKDDFYSAKKQIQNITNDTIREIDSELSLREKDILNY